MPDLTLICETCRQPIAGDTGSIYVTYAEIGAKVKADKEWRGSRSAMAAVDLAELIAMPGDIHWHTGHDACRTDHDMGCYEIDAPLISTWPHVARWTAHLMEKNWFALSDWDNLLRELSGEAPSRRIRVAAREAA